MGFVVFPVVIGLELPTLALAAGALALGLHLARHFGQVRAKGFPPG